MTNQPSDPDSPTDPASPAGSSASSRRTDNRDLAKLALPPTVGVLLAMTRDLNDTTPRAHVRPRRRSLALTLALIAGVVVAAAILLVAARRGRAARRGPAPVSSLVSSSPSSSSSATAAPSSEPSAQRARNSSPPAATVPGRVLTSGGGVTVTEIPVPGAAAPPEGDRDQPVEIVTPLYPEAARRLGVGGTVEIEATIDASGRVVVVAPIAGQAMFREPVETALMHSRFPATAEDGGRALTRRRLRVVFSTDDAAGERADKTADKTSGESPARR